LILLHEAFKNAFRGAQAADLSLLVVSAVDGVKPQSVKVMEALRAAQAPFIVSYNQGRSSDKILKKSNKN